LCTTTGLSATNYLLIDAGESTDQRQIEKLQMATEHALNLRILRPTYYGQLMLIYSYNQPHCASKGAVVMLTRQIALDYGPDRIHCNALCPGYKLNGRLFY